MKVVALVSGGKDSCYNMMQCVAEGHEIVALANLHPKDKDELDSYMYQTVGHMGIEKLAEAMELPLYRIETKGISKQRDKDYVPTDDDEVEDLYKLLKSVRDELQIQAVAVGAIFSDYQRIRVENVCSRLNLISLAYLWRRDQTELLQEMIDCQIFAIIIKVASLGLLPDRHLGKSLRDMQSHLIEMEKKYGLNVCGEGGEYETFTLNCPLFKKQIVVDDMQTIISSKDPVCPVGYINFTKLRLMPKTKECIIEQNIIVKKSLDFIHDIHESSYSDLSDPDLSETELEHIEIENRLRESLSKEEYSKSRTNSLSYHNTDIMLPKKILTKTISLENNTNNILLKNNVDVISDSKLSSSVVDNNEIDVNELNCVYCSDSELTKSNTFLNTSRSFGDGGGGGGGGGNSIGYITINRIPLSTSIPMLYNEQQLIQQKFQLEIPINKPNYVINSKGWLWISGIQGCGSNTGDSMQIALIELQKIIDREQFELNNICSIMLYIKNICDYDQLNDVYATVFNYTNPPTRICVQCPLPKNCFIIMEVIAFRPQSEASKIQHNRYTMHVQGISHWAPANIGPFSQSIRIGHLTFMSGQLALVPGSMTIIAGGIRTQCKLSLRHIGRIAKAMNANGHLRDVVQCVCFVTSSHYITEARRQWERRTTNAIVDYIVVPALPCDAVVEWHVWAHAYNDKFDYEEVRCTIEDYTIFTRKRWNYENNCSAVVQSVSTGLATSTTQLTELNDDILQRHQHLAKQLTMTNIMKILKYTIKKLLTVHNSVASTNSQQQKSTLFVFDPFDNEIDGNNNNNNDYNSNNNNNNNQNTSSTSSNDDKTGSKMNGNCDKILPTIQLKIFYQINATSTTGDILWNGAHEFQQKMKNYVNLAVTVIPVCSLENFSTFLSICGIRYE